MRHQSVTLLLAGDIHDAPSALGRLTADVTRCRLSIDAVVSAGDFTTAPQAVLDDTNRSIYLRRVRATLHELQSLGKPVYWVRLAIVPWHESRLLSQPSPPT